MPVLVNLSSYLSCALMMDRILDQEHTGLERLEIKMQGVQTNICIPVLTCGMKIRAGVVILT